MPIFFSLVARGAEVLADYASCNGNFSEVTDQILPKIPLHDDKVTYSHGNYLFHYISENKLIYFCITDNQFHRSRAFLFLMEIKKRFTSEFNDTVTPNSDFVHILTTVMKHYSESKDLDKISRIHVDLEELNKTLKESIEQIVQRGRKLDEIIVDADRLATSSVHFTDHSRQLKQKLFWKHVKMYVILALVVALAVYLIGAMSCGGFAWKNCVG